MELLTLCNIPAIPTGLSVEVRVADQVTPGAGALATIYQLDGTPLANPFTAGAGRIEAKAAKGLYDVKLGGGVGSPDTAWNGGAALWVYSVALLDKSDLTLDDVSDSATRVALTPNEKSVALMGGFKNKLINGDFSQWQRGAPISCPASVVTYTADRWLVFASGDSASAFVGADDYHTTMAVSGAPGITSVNIAQRIEAQNLQFDTGTYLTLQARLYASAAGKAVNIEIYSADAVDNFSTTTLVHAAGVIGLSAGSFIDFETTFQMTAACRNGIMVHLSLGQPLASTESIAISQAQLEVGSSKTEFERRPVGVELDLCRRYFERLNYAPGVMAIMMQCYSASSAYGGFSYYPKRATPVVAHGGPGFTVTTATGGGDSGTFTFVSISRNRARVDFGSGSLLAPGDATGVYSSGGTNYIDIDAEL